MTPPRGKRLDQAQPATRTGQLASRANAGWGFRATVVDFHPNHRVARVNYNSERPAVLARGSMHDSVRRNLANQKDHVVCRWAAIDCLSDELAHTPDLAHGAEEYAHARLRDLC
jgi:hypothetical protein